MSVTIDRPSFIDGVFVDRDVFDRTFDAHQLDFQKNLAKIFYNLLESVHDTVMIPDQGLTLQQHSLIMASLAEQDGASEETVVCSLLHDISLVLCPYDHETGMSLLLRPYISEANQWALENHALLNRVYMTPSDPSGDRLKDHPHYSAAMRFSQYDFGAFKKQPHQPLSHFKPMLERFFAKPVVGYESSHFVYRPENHPAPV